MLPRKIYQKIEEQKNDRKISLIIGPRQVGKTTILKELKNQNSYSLFLDLDILSNYEKISTYEHAINTLKLNGYDEKNKKIFYLFIDEFQRYKNLSNIMKNLFDNHENIKIYASGSSSITIKNQFQESLAGRKIINEILPLDFEEFLWFKHDEKAIEQLKNLKNIDGAELSGILTYLNSLLEEFLVYGGYPEVVLKKTNNEKIQTFESIFDLYLKKDLVDYLNIEKILNIKKLIEIIAVNNGQKIKYEEIASNISLSQKEVKDYLELLKETYLISIIRPYYTNKNKELVKIPKIYFIDNGVRNYFINNFNALKKRDDFGFLLESATISELEKNGINNIKFWQDKNKNEVDIIIDDISKQTIIEVKAKQKLKSDDNTGINAFLREYPKTKDSYILNLGIKNKKDDIKKILFFNIINEIKS